MRVFFAIMLSLYCGMTGMVATSYASANPADSFGLWIIITAMVGLGVVAAVIAGRGFEHEAQLDAAPDPVSEFQLESLARMW